MLRSMTSGRWAVASLMVAAMVAPSSAAARTADKAVVQVLRNDRFSCSGTVIARRFVLTARRCVSYKGHLSAPRSLAVLLPATQGRRPDRYKVAGIDTPPREAGGARAGVVLLQVTTPLVVAPIDVVKQGAVVRRGSAEVGVWTGATSSRAVGARVQQNCRKGTPNRLQLCATLGRTLTTAAGCRRSSGSALTLSRRGRSILAGVGVLAGPSCRRDADLTFANLSRAPLARWIASARLRLVGGSSSATTGTAPGSGAPGTGTPPGAVAPGSAGTTHTQGGPLAPYQGTWSGEVSQDNGQGAMTSYQAVVRIDRDGSVGEVVGSSTYPDLACGGSLTFTAAADDGSVDLLERLTTGADRCLSGGRINLAPVRGERALSYVWTPEKYRARASGVLTFQP